MPKGNVKSDHSGRNGFDPTAQDRDFVRRAIGAGSTINDIAGCLNICDDTLRKHFKYEIVTSREKLKASAVGVLEDSLADGNLDAAKYVLSRIAGWTEKHDHQSSDGTMTPSPVAIFALPDNGRA